MSVEQVTCPDCMGDGNGHDDFPDIPCSRCEGTGRIPKAADCTEGNDDGR